MARKRRKGIRIVDEKQKTKNVKRNKRKKERERGYVDQVIIIDCVSSPHD